MERYFYLTKGSEYFFHHWLHTANCLESQWPVQTDPFLTNPPKGLTTTTWPEPHTVCWVRTTRLQPQFTSKHNLCWRPTSGDRCPISSILPLLLPHAKIWNCKAARQLPGGTDPKPNPWGIHIWATVSPGFGRDLFPLHGCLAPVGKSWFGFSEWHSTHASLGLKTQPQELQPMWMFVTQCLLYKNHCAPTSPWLSENSHEQSVKHYPGKPVITTSGSIWLSVGRVLAQRETVTACKKRSPWLL